MLPIPGDTKLTQIPKILEGAKLAFVLALRQAFSSGIASENLKYNQDPAQTKLKIFTAHPIRLEFYPSLVVSTGGGDCSFKYLQDDFVGEKEDEGLVEYQGQLSFNMSITILANGTVERERIVDHLIFFVRHLFVDVFRRTRSEKFNFDLVYTKDIQLGSENIYEVENKLVYEQTMTIPCYMEYNAVVDQSSMETLRAISVEEIQSISSIDIEQK